MHPGLDRITIVFTDSQQFDPVAELFGEAYIPRRDARYSFHINIGQIQHHPVRQGRQNGQFMGRIVAVHIQSGVRLGISFLPGFDQSFFKSDAFGRDFGQNIVAGTIQNAGNSLNPIAHQ